MADRIAFQNANVLISLALRQKELFDCIFDFESHTFLGIPEQRRGLFRRSPSAEFERLLSEAEALRSRTPGIGGWWQISWQDVASLLVTALQEVGRTDGWRFESRIDSFSDDDGIKYVILADEGASQQFAGEDIYHYETLSKYTEQEQKDRMKQYDRAVVDSYLFQQVLADSQNAYIQSPISEKLYDNVLDYYVSEGWIMESAFRRNYENEMYIDKTVEGIRSRVVARKNVKGLFTVGKYRTDYRGSLVAFQSLNYQPVRIEPDQHKDLLIQRNIPGFAILKLFEYIANDSKVKSVPFSLLSSIAHPGDDPNLLCIQSAMFTLVSEKLSDE